MIDVGPLGATRDFIDVRDVAEFLAQVRPAGAITRRNVASGREVSMQTLASEFAGAATTSISFRTAPERGRIGADRMAAEVPGMIALGLPRISLSESIRDMLDYARAAAAPLARTNSV